MELFDCGLLDNNAALLRTGFMRRVCGLFVLMMTLQDSIQVVEINRSFGQT